MVHPNLRVLIFLPLIALLFSLSISALLLVDALSLYIPRWLATTSKVAAMVSFIVFAGLQWFYVRGNARFLALWVFIALVLSAMGDVVNLNLSQTYYRHNAFIKHDYLADSVWFFMPAYLCYCVAVWRWLRTLDVTHVQLSVSCFIASAFGLLSYIGMYTPTAGTYVTSLTASYAAVIALPLGLAYRLFRVGQYSVAIGLVLATIADALIGQFWLFGNQGEGFYPAVREWNWLVYCTSQGILCLLPVIVSNSQNSQTDSMFVTAR